MHQLTKEPLPVFFIDLEPKESNRSVYEIKYICYMNIKFEAPRKKNDIVQCTKCSATGIQKHIAQDRILVLNAEVNTTQPCLKRIQILQQNALYVEKTTRPITKVATYIKTYKKQEANNNSTNAKLYSITLHKN
jgi:tRNA nucleotidyltransferase (CCA-adding enzyme)